MCVPRHTAAVLYASVIISKILLTAAHQHLFVRLVFVLFLNKLHIQKSGKSLCQRTTRDFVSEFVTYRFFMLILCLFSDFLYYIVSRLVLLHLRARYFERKKKIKIVLCTLHSRHYQLQYCAGIVHILNSVNIKISVLNKTRL